jgi:predicted nucleotidyltransferase
MSEIKTVLDKVVSVLANVSGIQSVVLGGSRARGTHSTDSDIDIGIYCNRDTLDLESLNKVAKLVDDNHRENLIVSPGEWGQWVNGGGWLTIYRISNTSL